LKRVAFLIYFKGKNFIDESVKTGCVCEFLYRKEGAKSLASGLVIDWNVAKMLHLITKKQQ
jgi:hypothetical protein